MTIVDCKFHRIYREAVPLKLEPRFFKPEDTQESIKPSYEFRTYFDIWVPVDCEQLQKLEIR